MGYKAKVEHRELGPARILSEKECEFLDRSVFGGFAICRTCGKKFIKNKSFMVHCSGKCRDKDSNRKKKERKNLEQ